MGDGFEKSRGGLNSVHLSTIANSKIGNQPWVNIQSAGWVNIQSAQTDSPMKHDDWLHEQLKDDTFAASFLTQAALDTEPTVFIAALRHVVDARGGLAKVADVGNLSKQNLYNSMFKFLVVGLQH